MVEGSAEGHQGSDGAPAKSTVSKMRRSVRNAKMLSTRSCVRPTLVAGPSTGLRVSLPAEIWDTPEDEVGAEKLNLSFCVVLNVDKQSNNKPWRIGRKNRQSARREDFVVEVLNSFGSRELYE